MVETTVVRTIRVKGTSEGIEKLTGDLNKLAGAQDNVAVVSEQSARRALSVEAAWKRQTMQVDENARAQSRIAQANKVADQALQQGLITQAQHAERLNLITQRYSVAGKATEEFTKNTGLARHELINLGRQAQDVGVSLVSGQSPFMVLAQQGSQIADVFISSGKSVGSFFTQAAGWAARFFTSTAGIVTGIGAVGAAAVYAAYQFASSQKTVQELLEEENRLLQVGKELIEAKTEAQKKYVAQLNQQTLYEAERNLVALQIKRNEAIQETIRLLERTRSVMTPSQVAGEMGEAPNAFTPSQVAGFKDIAEAAERLRNALAAGNPDIRVFNEAISSIARRYPEVRQLADDVLESTRETANVTAKIAREEALIAKLKGVATAEQERALGLQKVYDAQKKITAQMQADARATRDARDETVSWSVAHDEAVKIANRHADALFEADAAAQRLASSMFEVGQAALLANSAFVPFATTWASMGSTSLGTGGGMQGKQGLTQFDPKGYTSQTTGAATLTAITQSIYGPGGFDPNTGAPNAQGLEYQFNQMLGRAGGNVGGVVNQMLGGGLTMAGGGIDQDRVQLLNRAIDLLSPEQQAGAISKEIGLLKASPATLATNELIRQLNDKLQQLTEATDRNTEALHDVLSPFYSSDPRKTYLGFRAFGGGGIMTSEGPLPLRHYQGGGIANSPQVAVFGETSVPEAYVPVPSGKVPVEIKGAANSNERRRTVVVNQYFNAPMDRNVARETGFQMAQSLRRQLS